MTSDPRPVEPTPTGAPIRPTATGEPTPTGEPARPTPTGEPTPTVEPAAGTPTTSSHEEPTEAELLAEIDRELAEEAAAKRRAPTRTVGFVVLITAALGLWASFELTMGKFHLLENPGQALGCDVNPLIGCSNFLGSWQGSAFGPPNPVIGLMGFPIMGAMGAVWASGGRLPKWMNWATLGGATFAFGFITFLQYSALFVLRGLCPWCLVAWTAVGPMFFATLGRSIESGDVPGPRIFRHWVWWTLAWYALVIFLIGYNFRYQWLSMAGLY